MTTLEEQFAQLVADAALQQFKPFPDILRASPQQSTRTRTVYSVGEAINQRGQNQHAKLGAGSYRDPSARR